MKNEKIKNNTIAKKAPKLAAALQYDQNKDHAPRLIAYGKGDIAEQILKIAEENDIPFHQDTELAQLLENIELGAEIPEEAYHVVAEILTFVYRLSQSKT